MSWHWCTTTTDNFVVCILCLCDKVHLKQASLTHSLIFNFILPTGHTCSGQFGLAWSEAMRSCGGGGDGGKMTVKAKKERRGRQRKWTSTTVPIHSMVVVMVIHSSSSSSISSQPCLAHVLLTPQWILVHWWSAADDFIEDNAAANTLTLSVQWYLTLVRWHLAPSQEEVLLLLLLLLLLLVMVQQMKLMNLSSSVLLFYSTVV